MEIIIPIYHEGYFKFNSQDLESEMGILNDGGISGCIWAHREIDADHQCTVRQHHVEMC